MRNAVEARRRIHPESLLRIPLVERAFGDRRFRPTPRAVDCRWVYHGYAKSKVTGFNPFGGRFFYGAQSALASWLRKPHGSARPLNAEDRLLSEALFAVHDYLHAWAYCAIRTIDPKLGLGHGRINERNVEDLAFAHLATEAAATVGLDYWYLATVDLDEVCPIGGTIAGLTVRYHERHLPEYRRARPDLVVQQPGFFVEVARFYADGVFLGVDGRDFRHSARLARWLRHELQYGVSQRRYVRHWLRFLGHLPRISDADAERTLRCEKRRHQKLLAELGDALWALVKEGRDTLDVQPLPDDETWTSATSTPNAADLDPHLLNINALTPAELSSLERSTADSRRFNIVMDQQLSRRSFERFDQDKLPLIAGVRERRDPAALAALLKGEPLLPAVAFEPRDLMLFN